MKEYPLLIEERHWEKGCRIIAGVDEVGRGALAGPVYAGAVIFKPHIYDDRIRDSKKISAQARDELSETIIRLSQDWSIGIASSREIDVLNIRQATALAMQRALTSLRSKPDLVLIDGNTPAGSQFSERTVIDGDEKSFTIAAASILAKVKRDAYMTVLDAIFPDYHFGKNKGYGTSEHILNIKKTGPSSQHRISFLTRILDVAQN